MTVEFKDYYQTLGVERSASAEEIQRAYRKKARKAHPDVCKEPGAEQRFKELSEAYEVLRDPEKRARYDQLGSAWHGGDQFTPPPGWENVHFEFGGDQDLGGFSDFFSSLFGGGMRPGGRRAAMRRRGADHEATLALSLEEVAAGGSRSVTLEDGRGGRKTFDVQLPRGLVEGSRIRLAGQGGAGAGGGPAGDLHLVVRLLPHAQFAVEGHDLRTALVVTPWEAALGAEVELPTLRGTAKLKVSAGTQGGQVLRLRGQGLPRDSGGAGDLLAVVKIAVPTELSERERELFEQLARASKLRPSPRSKRP